MFAITWRLRMHVGASDRTGISGCPCRNDIRRHNRNHERNHWQVYGVLKDRNEWPVRMSAPYVHIDKITQSVYREGNRLTVPRWAGGVRRLCLWFVFRAVSPPLVVAVSVGPQRRRR